MILIDLPMPKACDVCPFNYDFCWCNAFGNHDEKWEKYSDDWNDHVCDRETRPEYCPLQEIVRCKDCIHRGDKHKCILAFVTDKQDFPYFFYDNRGEWFCADGKRNEG